MVFQDQVEPTRPEQIALVVDPVPVVPSTLVQARVDEGERLPALVRLVEQKPPVAKEIGRRRARPVAAVGALRFRVWNVLILARCGRRRRISVRRRQ